MRQSNLYKSALLLLTAVCFSLGSAAQAIVQTAEVYQGKADIKASQQVILLPGFSATKGSNVHVFIAPTDNLTVYNPAGGGALSAATPSGTDNNYVWSTTLRQETTDETIIPQKERVETIQYFDGLGRLSQTVNRQGSPDKYDIVQPVHYDDFGREFEKYMPYIAGTQNGAYISSAIADCKTFYASAITGHESDNTPFSTTLFENSPLNRVVGEIGVGAAWAGHPKTIAYKTNTSNIPGWNVVEGSPATYSTTTYSPISYPANSLYVTESTDENGSIIREYKDKLGNVVCKEAVKGSETLSTYYIYDDFNLLRCVVPPLADGPSDTGLCYFYTYDGKNRMVEKKLPDSDPVYMVYDRRDRLAMTQDGNDRQIAPIKQWKFTLYDALNRPVITGILNSNDERSTVQGNFTGDTGSLVEVFDTNNNNSIYGYTGTSMPDAYTVALSNVQTVTWYDNYNFLSIPGSTYAYQSPNLAGNPSSASTATKGLVTGTLVQVLTNADDIIANDKLYTVNYYDEYGRAIRTVANNHLGGKDITYRQYNFSGQVLSSILSHTIPGKSELQYAQNFKYDHQGRLLSEKVKINDQAEITLTANEYNKLGEVVAKYYHGDASGSGYNQKEDFSYTIRGWLRGINTPGSLNSDLFALSLNYENPTTGGALTANAAFNGNISQMRWQSFGNDPKGYGFNYDQLSRLTAANYADGASFSQNAGSFSTSYGYDKNGNINLLNRAKNGVPIDQLGYTYFTKSNRLRSVTDATSNADGYHALSGEYAYDNNGNMNNDPSKGGATIAYNYLNLPRTVTFGGDDKVRYVYDATGVKHLKAVAGSTASNAKTVHYSGPFIYEDNDLKCIFTSAGRVTPVTVNGNVLYMFEYNLTDHLGNVRVTFGGHSNGEPEVLQVTDYYPFGLVMAQQNFVGAENSMPNRYLYNGKEIQDDVLGGTALDWYDYGARMYDATIGRWHCLDQLAEKYFQLSPYNYVANNPIKAIDPDGKVVIFVNGQNGRSGGSQAYWGNFATKVMNKIGDHNAMYFDGASGGWSNTLTRGFLTGINLSADNRRIAGKNMARETAESIILNLKEGESIKLISHSMGAAYSKGFIAGLQEYAKKNHKKINIEFEVDFAPFQPESQKANEFVPTRQASHYGDAYANSFLSDNVIEGAFANYTHPFNYSTDEHGLNSFSDEIDEYVPTSRNNAPGNSSWEEKGSGMTWGQALSIISSWFSQCPNIQFTCH